MDTLEINNTISKIPKISNFFGTFALDQIPTIKSGSLIINLDPSFKKGSHWTALFVKNGKTLYFDSFAQKPPKEILKKYKIVEKIKNPIQPIFSSHCGFYAIYFLYLKSLNYKMSVIEKIMRKIGDEQIKKNVLDLTI